jgi:hypothetical protein
MINDSNVEFTFTCYTLSFMPKWILVNCSSSVIIQLVMVRSCIHSWASVLSMIISLTSGWNKVSSKCCLIILGGIFRLTAKTHIGSIGYFGINFVILRSIIWTSLQTSSVWMGTFMVPIENMSNFIANITSSSSSNIL